MAVSSVEGAARDAEELFSQAKHVLGNPIKLYKKTFYFHFKNLYYAKDRKNTFLCFEVNRNDCDLPVPLHQGVFKKEGHIHAELCFLYWFHDQVLKVLPPGEEFKITWYMSWSPCSKCAEQVANFLATHHNLSLAIFSARFYYRGDPNNQQMLCRLVQGGARMAAMDLPEFKKCWNKFVYNDNQPFRPWKRLHKNFRFQDSNLQKILRSCCILGPSSYPPTLSDVCLIKRLPESRFWVECSSQMSLLGEEVFNLQFNNSHWVQPVQHRYSRRKSYLCYQLEQSNGQEPLKGCLLSKKGKQHAEILFLDKMRSMELSQVRITCYLTWSPCPNCAWELAAFKKDHPDLILRIYASRLYFYWRRAFQKGLCSLWQSGIQMDVMDLPQFTDCWRIFVNSQRPFRPWNELEKNSWRVQRRLRRIKESWGLQDLVNDFENLQLGPPLP